MDPLLRTPLGEGDFTLDEVHRLEEQNLYLPSNSTTKRKVSAALLSPPASSSGSVSGSSSSSASVRTRNFGSRSLMTFEIPTSLVSTDALEFIGFVPSTANAIFQRYQNRRNPNQNPNSLMDFVNGHISMLNSVRYEAFTLRQAMQEIGLIQELQDVLMKPKFTRIFWTESLYYWVKDTLNINYNTLSILQQRLKNHARTGGRGPRRGDVQGLFPRPEPPVPQVTCTVNMTPKDHALPANHIALESEKPLLPDHVTLYKAKSPAEMVGEKFIRDDGTVDMEVIASWAGGDFNHGSRAWYWTLEKEVAELYRDWAAERCYWAETWVIRIQIPSTFFSTLSEEGIWFSPDWKEYVWYCKRQHQPPPKFDRLWRENGVDIVRGHICTGVTKKIAGIAPNEVQTKINADSLLTYTDSSGATKRGIQVVFMQTGSVNRVGDEVRGKIHIEITAALCPADSS